MTTDKIFFLHKKGDIKNPKNFRAITISHPVTKLCEQIVKILYLYHCDFMKDDRNYAYSKNKSTTIAILDLYLNIDTDIKSGHLVSLLLTDFSSAFESIQSNLIIDMIRKVYDESEVKLSDWLLSFASEKCITADSGEKILIVQNNDPLVGYPQGSIISPIAWLHQSGMIYFNFDQSKQAILSDHSEIIDLSVVGFADDNIKKIVLDKNKISKRSNPHSLKSIQPIN